MKDKDIRATLLKSGAVSAGSGFSIKQSLSKHSNVDAIKARRAEMNKAPVRSAR